MFKNKFVIVSISAVMMVCGATLALGSDSRAKNKALAQRVFDEALNKGKYEVFSEYVKDFVKHVDGRNYTLEQEIEQAKGTRAPSSDLVMTVDLMIAEGDKVAIFYTGRGTNDGSYGGLPPTGRKIEISGMTIYRFVNGKIAEEWTSYNDLEILRQLGYYKDGKMDLSKEMSAK